MLIILLGHAIHCYHARKKAFLRLFRRKNLIVCSRDTIRSKNVEIRRCAGVEVKIINLAQRFGGCNIVIVVRELYVCVFVIGFQLIASLATPIDNALKRHVSSIAPLY